LLFLFSPVLKNRTQDQIQLTTSQSTCNVIGETVVGIELDLCLVKKLRLADFDARSNMLSITFISNKRLQTRVEKHQSWLEDVVMSTICERSW
jgi:hypothetical protein